MGDQILSSETETGGTEAPATYKAETGNTSAGGPATAQKASAWMRRFGIKVRLMLAFGAVASMTVVASVVAWTSYTNIASSFSKVTEQSVPAMRSALNLAAESATLSAVAPSLAAAESESERAAQMAELEARIETLGGAIDRLSETSIDTSAVEDIKALEEQSVANLRALNDVVTDRLQRQADREAAAAEVRRLQGEILAQLVPLVDDANFELVLVSEDTTTEVSETLQRLLNEGVNRLRRILEVNAQTNLAVGILSEAANVQSSELLTPAKERFTAASQALGTSLAELPETEAFADLRNLVTLILDFGNGDDSVFEMRRRELEATGLTSKEKTALRDQRQAAAEELIALHQEFLNVAVPMIDDVNFELVIEGEDAVARNAELIQTLVNEGVGNMRAMVEALAEVNLIAGLLSQGANALDRTLIQPLNERYVASVERLTASLAAMPSDEATETLKSDIEALVAFGRGDDSIFARRTAELDIMDRAQQILTENLAMAEQLTEQVGSLVAAADQDMSQATEGVTGAIGTGRTQLLIITAVSLLAACLIAVLYVGRSLVARLTGLARVMGELADGNLKVEIPTGGSDEITGMAKTLFVFRSGLLEVEAARERTEEERRQAAAQRREEMQRLADNFESSVKGVVEGLTSASGELQSTAEEMSSTAEQTSEQSSRAANAIEAATTNVQTVASSAEELSMSIQEIGQQVQHSSKVASEAASQALSTNTQVEGLSEAADKIGEVVTMISEIAGQTNLLALNATIEAARAGEAGKGFAVVASEVKVLAEQTAKATEQIAKQIADMQSATGSAVTEIQSITRTIETMNEIAATISAAVEQQNAATQEISRGIQEAATGATEVSTNVSSVNQAAGQTGSMARSVLDASSALAKQSDELRGFVDDFLKSVRAA